MSLTITLIAVGVVFAVYLVGKVFASSWMRTGASIDRILAEVSAAPTSQLVRAEARSVAR
jgi:hypothetical protein